MKKLSAGWIPKRPGILDHYKSMSRSAIVLFDVYLLTANKDTCESIQTIDNLQEILGWGREAIMRAKRELLKKRWIEPRGQSIMFIKNLVTYQQDTNSQILNSLKIELNSLKTELFKVLQLRANSSEIELNSSKTELNSSEIEPPLYSTKKKNSSTMKNTTTTLPSFYIKKIKPNGRNKHLLKYTTEVINERLAAGWLPEWIEREITNLKNDEKIHHLLSADKLKHYQDEIKRGYVDRENEAKLSGQTCGNCKHYPGYLKLCKYKNKKVHNAMAALDCNFEPKKG